VLKQKVTTNIYDDKGVEVPSEIQDITNSGRFRKGIAEKSETITSVYDDTAKTFVLDTKKVANNVVDARGNIKSVDTVTEVNDEINPAKPAKWAKNEHTMMVNSGKSKRGVYESTTTVTEVWNTAAVPPAFNADTVKMTTNDLTTVDYRGNVGKQVIETYVISDLNMTKDLKALGIKMSTVAAMKTAGDNYRKRF